MEPDTLAKEEDGQYCKVPLILFCPFCHNVCLFKLNLAEYVVRLTQDVDYDVAKVAIHYHYSGTRAHSGLSQGYDCHNCRVKSYQHV